MGEVIFIDKPVLRVPKEMLPVDTPVIIQSLKKQIDNLPSEAKLHLEKLELSEASKDSTKLLESVKELGLLHSKGLRDSAILFLNAALINHSCSPNSTFETFLKDGDPWCEIRAIKDISKAEEVTIFYGFGLKEMNEPSSCSYMVFGKNSQERRTIIREHFHFDCKCCVCTGAVPEQEDIIEDSLGLHALLKTDRGKALIDRVYDRIVDLTLKLYIGPIEDKIVALDRLNFVSFFGQDLKWKGEDGLKKIADDTGIRSLVKFCEEGYGMTDTGFMNLGAFCKENCIIKQ